MKLTYVYLNTYENGKLYVGSHTWNAPEGFILDPNYFGSSRMAETKNWALVSVKVLEVVSEERKFIAEREWIEKYAAEYGIDASVKYKAHQRNNFWVDRFKDGVLLNGHANTLEQARINGHSKETIHKQYLTKLSSGKAQAALAAAHNRLHELGRRCIINDGFVGTYSEIKEHTGLSQPVVSVSMTNAFRRGSYTNRYGWTFQPWKEGVEFNSGKRAETTKYTLYKIEGVFEGTLSQLSNLTKVSVGTLGVVKKLGHYVLKKGPYKGMIVEAILPK